MDVWIITCDERRIGALTTGALEAGAVLAGTSIATVDTLKDAAIVAADAGVRILLLDASSSTSQQAGRDAIAAVRVVRGDGGRIVLVVDQFTRPGEPLVMAALADGVKDIVAAAAATMSLTPSASAAMTSGSPGRVNWSTTSTMRPPSPRTTRTAAIASRTACSDALLDASSTST